MAFLHFYMDYYQLNKLTIKYLYPLPIAVRFWAVILYRPAWERHWAQCGLTQSKWSWTRCVPKQVEQHRPSN